jgi:aspartate aminotransferase
MTDGIDAGAFFDVDEATAARLDALTLSEMAQGMAASRILVIAYAVKAKIAAGEAVANFTVGDFAPSEFPVPPALKQAIVEALEQDQTNYPPADGVPELRRAIVGAYERELGLRYPIDAVCVASGARPVLYAAYRCLLDPGEKVVTPAPSWNNPNFCHLTGAEHVTVPSRPEDGFNPTAERLAPALRDARLLVLNSPMNPCGTMLRGDELRAICEVVVEENRRREAAGERLLYVIYDQVYRLLTFDAQVPHVTPVGVLPEMAKYTLFTDAISKSFAATGLRVGWLVGPPAITRRIKALATHMGAWAPRPEQLATARLLDTPALYEDFLSIFKSRLQVRLTTLYDAFMTWKSEGLPVDAIAPEGALYLSVHLGLDGKGGLSGEDAVREYILDEAGVAYVPFSAFGDRANDGWVRFSVGAVTDAQIEACLPRLEAALRKAVSGQRA